MKIAFIGDEGHAGKNLMLYKEIGYQIVSHLANAETSPRISDLKDNINHIFNKGKPIIFNKAEPKEFWNKKGQHYSTLNNHDESIGFSVVDSFIPTEMDIGIIAGGYPKYNNLIQALSSLKIPIGIVENCYGYMTSLETRPWSALRKTVVLTEEKSGSFFNKYIENASIYFFEKIFTKKAYEPFEMVDKLVQMYQDKKTRY
jgi:hypothetical protein